MKRSAWHQRSLLVLFCAVPVIAVPRLFPVHPGAGDHVFMDEFLVAVSVSFEAADTQAAGWGRHTEITLDSARIDAAVDTENNLITWVPGGSFQTSDSSYGTRILRVNIRDSSGTVTVAGEWRFVILKRPSETPAAAGPGPRLEHNGRIYAEVGQYLLSGYNTWELTTGGQYAGHVGKLHFSADVALTNQTNRGTQDRNTYSASVGYGDYLNLTIGDTRATLHPSILAGQRIRGVEAGGRLILPNGLNPVNVDFVWGQAQRAVAPDVYERYLTGARLSFGSGREGQFGLVFLKGTDRVSSLSRAQDTTRDSTGAIVGYHENKTAADNLVIGSDLVIRMLQQRIEVFGTYALSLYTRDINRGTISAAVIDSALGFVPLDPQSLSSLLIVNMTTTPLHPSSDGFLNSSCITAGLNLNLPFSLLREQFHFRYDLQGSNYYSMGNSLSTQGKNGFWCNEQLWLLDDRWTVSADFNRYENNFDGNQPQPTVSTGFSVGSSFFYSPRLPGVTVTWSLNQSLNATDSLGFRTGVSTFNVNIGYGYRLPLIAGNLQVFGGWSNIDSRWMMNRYDSAVVTARDTGLSFASGIYGVSASGDVSGMPLSLTAGVNGNAGGTGQLRLINGLLVGRYRIPGELFIARAGISIGGAGIPGQERMQFRFKTLYGVDLRLRSGHCAVFDGYVYAFGDAWDVVNMIKYEWRF